jgi:hypothetical protein
MEIAKKVYILTSCCDEGFDGPDFVYRAQSELEVAQHIVHEMNSFSNEGVRLLVVLMRADIMPKEKRDGYYSLGFAERDQMKREYIRSLTPEGLLSEIEGTYADGDSYFQITITEINLKEAIEVQPIQIEVTKTDPKVEVIKIDSADSIDKLFDFIFQDLEVSHLVWDGKTWYSHSLCAWSNNRKDLGKRPWDPDYPCYGYWGHNFDVNDQKNEGDLDSDVEPPYKPHMVKKMEDFAHIFNRNGGGPFRLDTQIQLDHDMHVHNPFGHTNSDHRGSNHMGIEIDHLFEGLVEIKAGIYTLSEFANLAWRAKANKFDNQYEAVFRMKNGGELDFDDNVWHVTLSMDHGS